MQISIQLFMTDSNELPLQAGLINLKFLCQLTQNNVSYIFPVHINIHTRGSYSPQAISFGCNCKRIQGEVYTAYYKTLKNLHHLFTPLRVYCPFYLLSAIIILNGFIIMLKWKYAKNIYFAIR